MKRIFLILVCTMAVATLKSQDMNTIELLTPKMIGGSSLKTAFENRRSERLFADSEIAFQDLSDLMWAANGFNREDKRTAATAMNRQEIDVYVCSRDGAFLYDAKFHALRQVSSEDVRGLLAAQQDFAAKAPIILLIVADMERFGQDDNHTRMITAYDAGIVSQNIYLFCAGNGLATVCRASMDHAALAEALGLGENHVLHLNHPVGYIAGQ